MPFAHVSLDEMNKEVLAWDIHQMLSGEPMYSLRKVPVHFSSIDQYLDIFEPLLLEECRSQILRSMGESEGAARVTHRLKLLAVEPCDPFRVMRFEPPAAAPTANGKPALVETDLVCVSYEPLNLNGAVEGSEGDGEAEPSAEGHEFHALALVSGSGHSSTLSLKLYLPSERTTRLTHSQYKRLVQLRRVMVPTSGEWYVQKLGNMVTINREFQALYAMRELALCDALLSPGPSREMLPQSASLRPSEQLIKAIENHFDPSQLRAIRMTLTGRGVTLIQGPPGTGKTKTILGILSVLLTTQDPSPAQPRHNEARPPPLLTDEPAPTDVARLLSAAAPWLRSGYSGIDAPQQTGMLKGAGGPAAGAAIYPRAGSTDRWLSLGRAVAEAPPRHVMVCAPSNAAIDEIVSRILAGQDESRGVIGMMDATGKHWVPKVVRVGPNVKDALLIVSLDVVAKKRMLEKEGLTYDAAKIEVLNEAQIVCTTLSCAGYAMFNSLKYGFDTVLVDEAAQAVEVSALIPLRYACRRLILVGDPKQLPATVFSEAATGHNYEQSLFQRLQKGGQQVALLTTQYRMNPAISRFPTSAFYHGALRDAPSLARAPPQPWHERRVLSPYVVFDVADGRAQDTHSSWYNDLEAQLALLIVKLLLDQYGASITPDAIGFISPYNAQVRHVRKLFSDSLGAHIASKIEVNSVDGFQGREKSIILFSTVRSDFAREFARGIGFVKDERRINVSMTRAQNSLFILGNAQTLAEVAIWARLLKDARQRKCVLKATSPLSIWFETAAAEMNPPPAAVAGPGATELPAADAEEEVGEVPEGGGLGTRPARRAKV